MLEAYDTCIAAMSLHRMVSQKIFTFVTKSQMQCVCSHSFIHFILHISIYRLNTKDVEIVIVVVTISGKVNKCHLFQYIY
jgi:hypothetical protein